MQSSRHRGSGRNLTSKMKCAGGSPVLKEKELIVIKGIDLELQLEIDRLPKNRKIKVEMVVITPN